MENPKFDQLFSEVVKIAGEALESFQDQLSVIQRKALLVGLEYADETVLRGDTKVCFVHEDGRGPARWAVVNPAWLQEVVDAAGLTDIPHDHIEIDE